MLAHGQTTIWGLSIDTKARPGGADWLRRLRSRLRHPRRRQNASVLPISYWDGAREQLRQPTAESALDYAAALYGESWAIKFYSALV